MAGLSEALGSLLAAYGLAAIFVVMLLKEIGVPVPAPSDLIMITAGVQAATGSYGWPALLLAVAVATFVGSSVQFILIRSAGRQAVLRVGAYVGLTAERLDKAGASLRGRGAAAIFLGLNVPGARAGIIPAAGLAGIRYAVFAPAMLAGSLLFYGWHIALGFIVGPSATSLLAGLHVPLAPVMLLLAVVGLAGWLLLRARRKGRAADSVHTWLAAACPACLAAGVIQGVAAQRRLDMETTSGA